MPFTSLSLRGLRRKFPLTARRRAVLALLPPLLALALQKALWELIDPYVWFLFFPAVFASSWIGGLRAGLRAALLSVLIVWWIFIPPAYVWLKGPPWHVFPVTVFLATGIAISYSHERLRRGEQRLRDYFDQAGDGIFIADEDGRFVAVNAAGCSMLRHARHELIGRSFTDFLSPPDLSRLATSRRVLESGGTEVSEWTLRRADDSWLPVEITAKRLPGGQWQAFVRDVSERHRAEAQLKLSATVFDSTQEAILVTDANRCILTANSAFSAISGYALHEVQGRDPSLLQSGRHDAPFYAELWQQLHHTGQWQGEIWNRRKNGEIFPAWENISQIKDASGAVSRYVSILSDITPMKRAEAQLQHLAHHDTLTGLPNRLLFADNLQQSIARAQRHCQRVALLFIDLDRFKFVNDSLGHAAGDQLLTSVGQRLRHAVRGEDTVARLGGDEFTVIVEEVGSPDDVAALCGKLIALLSEPCVLAGREVVVSASIGIALYPDDAASVENLCKAADSAMYSAKERGRGTFDFYTPDITERVNEHLMLDNALRRALERDELRLFYQPQFAARSGRLTGVEALLRWQHPEAGLLEPARFIPVAEQSALINDLGIWALRQACAQQRAWLDLGLPPLRVAVNVSGRQVMRDHLLEAVTEALGCNRLTGAAVQLELELTESVLQAVEPSAEILHALKALGVRVAIDDFGTGYSSLSVIKQLPIDTLKIDRLFVRNLPDDDNSRAIVGAVLSMSHALGLRVVAEGVETVAQRDFLAHAGCDEMQGFLFGAPADAEATTRLLAASAGAARAGRSSAH